MTYTAYGIDYTGGLPATTLARATVDGHPLRFVGRYLSDYPSKNLTPQEARALSAVGVEIVVFWEDGATDAEQGYAAGVHNAKRALAQARACGMPTGRPILMCVDENTTVGPHVRGYFQGAGSVLGRGARGVYGSYAIVHDLFQEDLVDFAMQTYAWSGDRWEPRAQLQQYSNGHTLAGADVDYDRATATDYGQWRVGVTPSPTASEEDRWFLAASN